MVEVIDELSLQEIDVLSKHEPRLRAIRLLAEGRVDEFLDWERGDGCMAAYGRIPAWIDQTPRLHTMQSSIALDRAFEDRQSTGRGPEYEQAVLRLAIERVSFLFCSPLEIVLRAGTTETFKKAVLLLTSPEMRSSSIGTRAGGAQYGSLLARSMAHPSTATRDFRREGEFELPTLAVMLGKAPCAKLMVEHGLAAPTARQWWTLSGHMSKMAELTAEAASIMHGADAAGVDAACRWTVDMAKMCQEMDGVLLEASKTGVDILAMVSKVRALIARGAPVSNDALFMATQLGQLELLGEMFAAGGQPNGFLSSGRPTLANVDPKTLTSEALKIWLAAGVNPLLEVSTGYPLEGSAVDVWACAGRLDLLKQSKMQAAAPFSMSYQREDGTASPVLATALSEGHQEVSKWLIEQQGCRLADFAGPEDDVVCSDCAKGDFLAMARAWEERVELEISVENVPDAPIGTSHIGL